MNDLNTAMVYAGAGALNLTPVVLIGFAAAAAGDSVGFAIRHVGGRALVLRPSGSSPATAGRS